MDDASPEVPPRRRSLAGRLALALLLLLTGSAGLAAWLSSRLGDPLLAALLTLFVGLPLALWMVRRVLRPLLSLFRALEGTVSAYRDGDFSFGIAWRGNDELADLVHAHNALGQVLREQRQGLVQRELLLDTLLQNTPVAMLLIEPGGRVVFANLGARRMLSGGRSCVGRRLQELMPELPHALAEAVVEGREGVHSSGEGEEAEHWQLLQRVFRLNGQPHRLLLLRQLTHELRRAEVRTWKKVIRVISHELNNSLAPIASLAHSGGELLRRGQTERLAPVFETIEERARHLNSFIRGYARFAKLPVPAPERVRLQPFLDHLAAEWAFQLGPLPVDAACFDPAQLGQALLNLLKNAHESGAPAGSVAMDVRCGVGVLEFRVSDRGPGMPPEVMERALLPFYSTKRSGTGLGLALAREIAEAHGGGIRLQARPGGGVIVGLWLPQPDAVSAG